MSNNTTPFNRPVHQKGKSSRYDEQTSYKFYDTFVTRSDVQKLLLDPQNQKQNMINIIERFERGHLNRTIKFDAYRLITFEYGQTQTVSKATEESQIKCKHNIFSEYLLTLLKALQQYTFEQVSAFLSIGFYIFVESLERKITQIDSYEIFKRILRKQSLLTNDYHVPIFNPEQIASFNQLVTNQFYKFYSLYELRMTTYQEVNIYGRYQTEEEKQVKQEDQDSIREEEEQDFNDLQLVDLEQQNQEPEVIDKVDEEHISQFISEFKLNYNNKIEKNNSILQEAEKILNKKK